MRRLVAVAALALGSLVPSDVSAWGTPNCTYGYASTNDGYGVRDIRCVNGPASMVVAWDCIRNGAVVYRSPSYRRSFAGTATYAATCWNATPRIVYLYP